LELDSQPVSKNLKPPKSKRVTGRWTDEEHVRFVEGKVYHHLMIQLYGSTVRIGDV